MIEFRPIADFPRGTLFAQLKDAYGLDERWEALFGESWKEYDDFIYGNQKIALRCGFITVLDGVPIGHITWDPRKAPESVEVGHNCILCRYKGNGYGKAQLAEALARIREEWKPEKIIVTTNDNLIAKHNYEACGFTLKMRKQNTDESAFSGDYLYYEIDLRSACFLKKMENPK